MKAPYAALLIVSSLALAGCASDYGEPGGGLCDSDISRMGPDTYLSDAPCLGNYDIRHAETFCRWKGKEMLVQSMERGRGGYVVFQCLDSDDPANQQRPTYERSPDVRVEDAR